MVSMRPFRRPGLAAAALLAAGLGGCGSFDARFGQAGTQFAQATDERECLMRAMYFESNRSSEEGMLAVGTVVMNRVQDAKYPKSICGVVGQPKQFAPGVMTSPMTSRATTRVASVADRVLAGDRSDRVGAALHFHTAGYTFPYRNMHYVAVAGGNAFYEKKPNPTQTQVMVASLADREERSLLPASLRGRAMQVASRRGGTRENAIVTASLATPRDEDEASSRIATVRAAADRPTVERRWVEQPSTAPARAPSIAVATLSASRPEPRKIAKVESGSEPNPEARIVLARAIPARPATTRTGDVRPQSTKTGPSATAVPVGKAALPPSRLAIAPPPEPPKRFKLSSLRRPVDQD